MSIKDILVQIDGSKANGPRLDFALDLARRHGAHLTGLCIFDIGLVPGAGFGVLNPEDSLALIRFQDQLRTEALATAAELEAEFRERLRREGLSGEWRLAEGRALVTVPLHARYADLIVLGQQDPDDDRVRGWTAVLEAALLGSGRPILVLPYAGTYPSVGRRALIGWNARQEAARAVHDALPLLREAESVTILAIDPSIGSDGHGDEPAADLALHLARHGLKVMARQTVSVGLDPADVLLNAAADDAIDLLVIGGYGHSRMREIVLGGVTRRLLRGATIPVLMSH